MKVLGVDPSTKTGLALVDENKKVLFATELEFKKQTGFERAQSIVAGVVDVIATHKPDLIVIEEMIVGHASSALTVIQIATMIRYFLWQEGIVYAEVHPSSLKKFVAGNGNAKKEQIMMWVSKNWNYQAESNNVADAVGLAMLGLCWLKSPFTVAHREAAMATRKKQTTEVEVFLKSLVV